MGHAGEGAGQRAGREIALRRHPWGDSSHWWIATVTPELMIATQHGERTVTAHHKDSPRYPHIPLSHVQAHAQHSLTLTALTALTALTHTTSTLTSTRNRYSRTNDCDTYLTHVHTHTQTKGLKKFFNPLHRHTETKTKQINASTYADSFTVASLDPIPYDSSQHLTKFL